ncbi:MAG TPA: amino acid adenylation domain-containing protein [Actinocrinis sp.]|nr:amino acid adenylation domain-containing protein [Actinocrinis sp.]
MTRPQVCLHELVEAQARRTPDAVALEFEGATMTYREYDDAATALAALLIDRGAEPDVLIGMACERSLEMMVALLGISKSGSAYVPVDLEAPAARIANLLDQSEVALVVATEAARDLIPLWAQPDTIYLDLPALRSAPPPEPIPQGTVTPDDLIYVIFTSGSTGQPKGVMNEHAPVCNRLLWGMENQELGPGDKVLQKTPVHFDVSVWEMFLPLCVGATLVIARPGGHRDTDYLVQTITQSQVTLAHFVPSMLYAFLEHPDVRTCTTLTRVYCSGEALTPELQERFFERLPAELHNMYGPTEAAIEVSHWRCTPGTPTVPIGHPLANTRLYVLDETMQHAGIDVPGELYIAGVPVARGYFGRPDLTEAVFLADPFAGPGERMYKTGDRALLRPDGAVEYLGRVDNQVKLRGQRIEPGEIEACLEAHPAVARAVVVLKGTDLADQRLVGYVVPRRAPGEAAERIEPQLLAHVRNLLPVYMVPSAVVLVDALPETPSGKVDRNALPEPPPPDHGGGREEPRAGIEEVLAQIWAEVLHSPMPDRRDRFLDVGGNSLLATVLAGRIAQRCQVSPSAGRIISAASLAELAGDLAGDMTRDQVGDPLPGSDAGAGPDAPAFPPARSLDELLLERIEQLSAEEVDALLDDLESTIEEGAR